MKNIFKVLSILIVLLIGTLVALTTLPEVGGYKTLVVSTGSMEPNVKQGSLIFIKEVTDPQKGDIITFKLRSDPRTLVTHRVHEVKDVAGEKQFQTKGDAVPEPDIQFVKRDQLIGKMFLTIPYLGLPITFAKTQLGVIVLIVIPASLIVYEELKKILSEVKKLRARVNLLEVREDKLEEISVEEEKPEKIDKKTKHKNKKRRGNA